MNCRQQKKNVHIVNVLANVADSKSKEKAGGTVMEDIRISVFRRLEETEYDANVGQVPEKHVMRCGVCMESGHGTREDFMRGSMLTKDDVIDYVSPHRNSTTHCIKISSYGHLSS